ncbi:AAA family ATPase [Dinoroseobacter sp. S375]|uniref:AAA family ATPase n=1 Tax=Dinoroseobacter sp. S375 TaxID=3415136 RepID=UPI003C7E2E84
MIYSEFAVQSENFKGVPNGWKLIQPVNFIVGENSAGKTSFLDLLSVLDSANFALTNKILGSVDGLDDPEDIITRYGNNKTIKVGYVGKVETEDDGIQFAGKIASYKKKSDELELETVTIFDRRSAFKTQLRGRTYFSKRFDLDSEDPNLSDACALADEAHHDSGRGYTKLLELGPEGPAPDYQDWFQATMQSRFQLAKNYQGSRKLRAFAAVEGQPLRILRYGPIRGEAERLFFGSTEKDFDPSGSHYPFRLKSLSDKKAASLDAIKAFGKASGLFDDIRVQPLRGGKQGSAFSILYKKYNTEFYSNELGYGLGQIIPIVTDTVSSNGDRTFLIQQPEVHLHPKAQAAFGSLLPKISERGVTFVIETHSDFIIDRFRMERAINKSNHKAQILFFYKPEGADRPIFETITISQDGLTEEMPEEYREFFVKEALAKFESL